VASLIILKPEETICTLILEKILDVAKSHNLMLVNTVTRIAWAMLVCAPNLVHMHSDATFN